MIKNRRIKVAALQSQNRRKIRSTEKNKANNGGDTLKDHVKRIAIGADHGAYDAKEAIKIYLQTVGYKVVDVGTNNSTDKVDYPDFAQAVAKKVVSGECERGIMLDAAGIGSSMAANKVKGARAALCWNDATIQNSRLHNNANIISIPGRFINFDVAWEMVQVFFNTKFEGGRHNKRVEKISQTL